MLVQLKVHLNSRVTDTFTLDLSCNYLLPETVPTIVGWLNEWPLLRVDLAANCLSVQRDLWPLLLDEGRTK